MQEQLQPRRPPTVKVRLVPDHVPCVQAPTFPTPLNCQLHNLATPLAAPLSAPQAPQASQPKSGGHAASADMCEHVATPLSCPSSPLGPSTAQCIQVAARGRVAPAIGRVAPTYVPTMSRHVSSALGLANSLRSLRVILARVFSCAARSAGTGSHLSCACRLEVLIWKEHVTNGAPSVALTS